ncbi:MAG: YigZ family protein [Candidatus Krumholzibacteriota bacterium]|nr:YigZ family protein [Candidatus Krumholzibacteriota bacterium]
MHPDAYAVLADPARAELRVKGSRFLALAIPVRDEAAATVGRDAVAREHPDATHHCWALRLGHPDAPRERHADAGEPAGSAGPPIARALVAAGLSDLIVIVVRWFGGTKLGVGGLIRAYGEAARLALEAAPRAERLRAATLAGTFPYELEAPLRGLLARLGGSLLSADYGEAVHWRVDVPRSALDAFRGEARELARGKDPFEVVAG